MEKLKFTATKAGKVMLVIWGLVGIVTLLFLISLTSKYAKFREHKEYQEAVVGIITSVTDEYDKYVYMSEAMVNAIEDDYNPYYYYNYAKLSESMKKSISKRNAAAEKAREAVAELMVNKGYSGFDGYDVERALEEYDFLEFDGDQHLFGYFFIPIILAVAGILNAILVYFYKHPTQASKKKALSNLKKLDEMLGYGMITQEEYEQKKNLLLASVRDSSDENASE